MSRQQGVFLFCDFILFCFSKRAFETLEEIFEETEVRNTTSIAEDNLLALLYKPNEYFKGLEISASENEVTCFTFKNGCEIIVFKLKRGSLWKIEY